MPNATQLFLRQVQHPAVQPGQAFRVICDAVEVGSIGLQTAAAQRRFWSWGIDTVEPLPFVTHGEADSREHAMDRFRAAWLLYAADAARLARLFEVKAATADRMKRPRSGE